MAPTEMLELDTLSAGHRRGALREQAILDAALELVAEVGYDRMSMDALAARARSSKATIYRRWPHKSQVVAEALRRRACPQGDSPVDTGSLRGDLLATMRHGCETLTSGEDGRLVLGLLLASRSDPELAGLLRSIMSDGKEAMSAELVRRGVARGELPPEADPTILTELVAPVLMARVLVFAEAPGEDFLAHFVDDIILPLLSKTVPSAAESH